MDAMTVVVYQDLVETFMDVLFKRVLTLKLEYKRLEDEMKFNKSDPYLYRLYDKAFAVYKSHVITLKNLDLLDDFYVWCSSQID